MTLRKGHGNGAGTPRVEVLPVDELPAGVPGPVRPAATRDDAGRFQRGPGTSEFARRGALAAHESRQLAQLLGLWEPPEGHVYATFALLAIGATRIWSSWARRWPGGRWGQGRRPSSRPLPFRWPPAVGFPTLEPKQATPARCSTLRGSATRVAKIYSRPTSRQVWSTWGRLVNVHRVPEAFLLVFRLGGPRVELPVVLRHAARTLYSVVVDISEQAGSKEKLNSISFEDSELLPTSAATDG